MSSSLPPVDMRSDDSDEFLYVFHVDTSAGTVFYNRQAPIGRAFLTQLVVAQPYLHALPHRDIFDLIQRIHQVLDGHVSAPYIKRNFPVGVEPKQRIVKYIAELRTALRLLADAMIRRPASFEHPFIDCSMDPFCAAVTAAHANGTKGASK